MSAEKLPNKQDYLSQSFVESLPRFFSPTEIQEHLRYYHEQLFVSETALENFVTAYQRWLKETVQQHSEKSTEKIIRRIFGDEELVLHYVIDGKRCLVGYLTKPVDHFRELKKDIKITPYLGNLTKTSDYLHPRDPLLSKIEGFRSFLDTHQGLLLYFNVHGKDYCCTTELLQSFAVCAERSEKLCNLYPQLKGALRNKIAPLLDLLKGAEAVKRKQKLLLPMTLKGKDELMLLRAADLVLVSTASGKLTHCFSSLGRSFKPFALAEMQTIKSSRVATVDYAINQKKESKNYPIRLFSQKEEFLLSFRALSAFLKQFTRSPVFYKNLKNWYTLSESLALLGSLFSRSHHLNEAGLKRLLRNTDLPSGTYRRVGAWYFLIEEKRLINGCWEVKM